jgi:hypothetical protein
MGSFAICSVCSWLDVSRMLKWAGHVARMGDTRNTHRVPGRYRLEAQSVGRSVILKLIINKYVVRVWIGLNWLRTRSCG